MKRRAFFFLAAICCSAALFGQDREIEGHLEQKDIEALRDWIYTRRQVTVQERGGNLSLSGEVRTELQSTNEKKNGIKQRGSGGAKPDLATRAWDIEVNLMLDYRTDRTWASIKLEFDNNAGTSSGTFNKIQLERAVFGGWFVNADTYTMGLEIGRRGFSTAFDSKVQFGSTMDGFQYKYDQALESIGSLYFHVAAFLIDERIDHYGYVGELGLLDIANTGLYMKFSVIDWDTKHLPVEGEGLKKAKMKARAKRFQFFNSQFILGYKFKNKWLWDRIMTCYAAILVNMAARDLKLRKPGRELLPNPQYKRYNKENLAWYVGFSVGELRKRWDWSFDINYQWVQAQAVPEFDAGGIGRGNAAGVGLYTSEKNGDGIPTTSKTAVGGANYKGISIDFLWLLTNNITIMQSWRQTVNANTSIGPTFSYKQYEIEFIYLF